MYLVSPTGEENEKQSMKRKKKKNKQCQGNLAEARGLKSRPFTGSGNDYLTCEMILQVALPLLLSHLINQEYLSTTNLLLPNFPIGVKQIFSSTL